MRPEKIIASSDVGNIDAIAALRAKAKSIAACMDDDFFKEWNELRSAVSTSMPRGNTKSGELGTAMRFLGRDFAEYGNNGNVDLKRLVQKLNGPLKTIANMLAEYQLDPSRRNAEELPDLPDYLLVARREYTNNINNPFLMRALLDATVKASKEGCDLGKHVELLGQVLEFLDQAGPQLKRAVG